MAITIVRCPKCHQHIKSDERFLDQEITCPSCDTIFRAERFTNAAHSDENTHEDDSQEKTKTSDAQRIASKLGTHLTDLAGVEKLEGFSLRELFSEVLRKHNREEIEEYFTVGTPITTPSIKDIDTSWPKPWVFFKTFLGALLIYILFLAGWNEFRNVNLIPGLIIVGSFAVPVSTLIFFFEVNARQNISLYQIIRLIFLGGILSLITSLILFQVTDGLRLNWLGASVAGLVEEPAKLLALLTVTSIAKYRYRLNGLLFGAAVGTGFAAFESAGYALRLGLFNIDLMKDMIMVRGLLSPFAHIAWTAMCGAALWRVKGANRFSFSMVRDTRFLRIFGIVVVLHMLWNSPLHLPFYGKHIILGIIAWVVIFGLIQDGLTELREEKLRHSMSENAQDQNKEPYTSQE